jgi:hypothetical protein
MKLTKLQFRPGINRETTPYANEGGWVDCDKIRFRSELPETIGGWERFTRAPFIGAARSLFPWVTLSGTNYVGAGTSAKYYVVSGGDLADVTPVRYTSAAGSATFAATDGSSVVVVTDIGHGAELGDFVTISAAASLGGAVTAPVLNREHRVTARLGVNSYQIDVGVEATAADTGDGGALTTAAYQIGVGQDSVTFGSGWGAGPWSRGGWGSAADVAVLSSQLRLWSQDNYGEDLLICPRGGGIYLWDATTGLTTRAVNITQLPGSSFAPTTALIVLVSERDRHTLAFGCDSQFAPGVRDPLLVRFSSQESLTDWDITRATNTAGEIRLGSGSEIIAALQTKQQVVVFTDSSLHALQFVGPPFTFGAQEVSAGTTIMGQNAAVAVGDAVFWMGKGEFYVYDGAVLPIPCTVKEFVFGNFNEVQGAKVCAGHNGAFSEIWWFYPSAGSESNDRYVVYNYMQRVWYYGTMARTAWVDRGLINFPLAASPDGYVYYHEFGFNDGSVNPPGPLAPFVESSVFDVGEGDQFMFASRLIPDITFRNSPDVGAQAVFTMKARNFPGDMFADANANPVSRTAVVPVERFTDQLFIRLRGRAMSLRVESNQTNTAWRLGAPRLELRTDGRR